MLHEDYDDALGTFSKVLMKEPANSLARINVGYICLKKRIFGEAIEHLSKAIRLDNDRKATLYAHYYLGLVYLEREMFEDAVTFLQKTLQLGPNLIEAYYELGRANWFAGEKEAAAGRLERRLQGQQVQSLGQALQGNAGPHRRRGRAAPVAGLDTPSASPRPRPCAAPPPRPAARRFPRHPGWPGVGGRAPGPAGDGRLPGGAGRAPGGLAGTGATGPAALSP